MSNKQVIAYGVLVSTNDLRSIFVGHVHFKELMKYFTVAWRDPGTRSKISFNRIYKNQFIEEIHFKKPFEFHSFSKIFYCRMTGL